MQRYEDTYGEPTQFHVVVRVISYHRDRDNYIVPYRTDTDTIEADTLDDLYERMAHRKSVSEVPTHSFDRNRVEVEFDTIYESVAEGQPDKDKLEATAAWQTHLVNQKAKADAKAAEEAAAEVAKAAKVKADEKALLASLLAKHGR